MILLSKAKLPAASRPAFTLLELLLTLAVLSAIFALVVPQTMSLLADRRLVRGADQLQIELTRLRVQAMREGRVMMLQGQLEGNTFKTQPFTSLADATEATDQTGSQSALLTGADQAQVVVLDTEASSSETIELPEDVQFVSVSVTSAARGALVQQQVPVDSMDQWSRPVLFYADGSTSTAEIVLKHPEVGQMTVKLRGITGDVSVSEVEALAENE